MTVVLDLIDSKINLTVEEREREREREQHTFYMLIIWLGQIKRYSVY